MGFCEMGFALWGLGLFLDRVCWRKCLVRGKKNDVDHLSINESNVPSPPAHAAHLSATRKQQYLFKIPTTILLEENPVWRNIVGSLLKFNEVASSSRYFPAPTT
nr:hypothetical protein CFP56_27681 [Quercus suber]